MIFIALIFDFCMNIKIFTDLILISTTIYNTFKGGIVNDDRYGGFGHPGPRTIIFHFNENSPLGC